MEAPHKSQSLNLAEGKAQIKSLQAANQYVDAQYNILKQGERHFWTIAKFSQEYTLN